MRQDVRTRRPARRLAPPSSPADVRPVGPCPALDAQALFALLHAARTWYPEPNWGTTMAFACTRDWVLKADLSRRSRRRERVLAQAERSAALTAEVGLWHPRKTWFVLHQRGRFLAANATPRLRVGARAWPFFYFYWCKRRLVARARAAGYRLDAREVNFGRVGLSLYYLDDEIYPLHR